MRVLRPGWRSYGSACARTGPGLDQLCFRWCQQTVVQRSHLFVFVYSAPGKILCAPGIPALVGRDATVLKDVDGKEFGKMILAAATEAGDWVEYRMTNPASKKVEPKKTYAVRSSDFVLGSGAYSQ